MNSYKKYYYIVIGILVLVFIALYQVVKVKDIDMDMLFDELIQIVNMDRLEVGDSTKLRNLYHINKNEVEEFILLAPKSNMDGNEILIINGKNEESVDAIKLKVEERIKKQEDSFKSYKQEEYELINDRILETKGQYLILIISRESKEIQAAVNKAFK